MDIGQFRVVLRARDFDRTLQFYGEVLALPRLSSWENEDARAVTFQAGTGAIEVLGQPRAIETASRKDPYDLVPPGQRPLLSFRVPSAERVYEELVFRDRNIPGGLRKEADGTLLFETHDPDGVKLIFSQAE